jgi:hypothetical protein
MTFRGTQSMTITAGENGSYGVVRVISNKVVGMQASNPVPQNITVLGTVALYKCTSSRIHITFFDNAALGSAIFARL